MYLRAQTSLSLVALLTSLSVAAPLCSAQQTGAESSYPLVFKRYDELASLGVAVGVRLPHKCYYYGDGGLSLSVSDQLLAYHTKKGFSLRSLCMALNSGIKFDPETGKRLPTAILFDIEALRKELWCQGRARGSVCVGREYLRLRKLFPDNFTAKDLAGIVDRDIVTDDIPLRVPNCFKRGTPYADCDWRFAGMTGTQVMSNTTTRFKRLGAELDRVMSQALRSTPDCSESNKQRLEPLDLPADGWPCRDWRGSIGGLRHAGEMRLFVETQPVLFASISGIPKNLLEATDLSFFDISDSFPKGYGYALYAEGGADPLPSASSLSAATDPTKKIDATLVKALRLPD